MTIRLGDFEPDADAFEDDDILANYLGAGEPAPSVALATAASSRAGGLRPRLPTMGTPFVAASYGMPDWPDVALHDVPFALDHQTITWFRQRHADWQSEIHFVLRAWVVAHTVSDAGN